uniref:Protein HYM1 n=1 Tax=Ogataea thermomethanolica (nom. inval.) TaxID=310468 RepID=A0A5P8D0U8_9ASCO|nr:protein HYM1 [Ogataea thermomethanolica (nom. inval.)]QGW56829.1 protein HYM1 [Ogataea thermomethanolica (nom. inval.)]
MAFLFKRNPKSPAELVRAMNEQLSKLDSSNDRKKAQDETTRYLGNIKAILTGNSDDLNGIIAESQPDQIAQLAHEIYSSDCLTLLIQNLPLIEFDSRKIVGLLFTSLLKRKIVNRSPTVDHLLQKPHILILLMKGPENPEVSINLGSMLREAIKYEQIARYLLSEPVLWKYFDYCEYGSFETSTEAFLTLSDLLTTHKSAASDFFQLNCEEFVDRINRLIMSSNYVTKRQSVKLLGQLILDKPNYNLMTTYVNSPHNLKLIMILLGDKSKNIQLESFNVFKIFIANPRKSKAIIEILTKNRERLLQFLKVFSNERKDDELFLVERNFVIEQIETLPKLVQVQGVSENSLNQEASSKYAITGKSSHFKAGLDNDALDNPNAVQSKKV